MNIVKKIYNDKFYVYIYFANRSVTRLNVEYSVVPGKSARSSAQSVFTFYATLDSEKLCWQTKFKKRSIITSSICLLILENQLTYFQ